jgi:hypothetical protein
MLQKKCHKNHTSMILDFLMVDIIIINEAEQLYNLKLMSLMVDFACCDLLRAECPVQS